jgi:hypothetical protein
MQAMEHPKGHLIGVMVLALSACGADTPSTAGTRNPNAQNPIPSAANGAVAGTGIAAAGVSGPSIIPGSTLPAAGSGQARGVPSGGVGVPAAGTTGVAPLAGTAAPPPPPPPKAGAGGTAPVQLGPGQTLPPVTDYTKMGPFPTITATGSGPDGMYTLVRPTNLGDGGFKHPPLTWGNGITTTPATYPILLSTVASHGFVIIASDSSSVTTQMMTAGLDWLIKQNDEAGSPMFGKLDTSRAVAMGYSLGGGGALGASAHPKVIATIAMHPAPGFGAAHAPVLLFTGTNDTICAPALVMSAYSGLTVPALMATLEGADHLEPVLTGGRELGPSIAWLRLWVYNDEGAKGYFYGANCQLCMAPWSKITNAAWK